MANGGQTRWYSFLESLFNVAVGYGVAVAAQIAIFPLFDIHIGLGSNLGIGGFFTGVSIIRSFLLRRLFNWYHTRETLRYTGEEMWQ